MSNKPADSKGVDSGRRRRRRKAGLRIPSDDVPRQGSQVEAEVTPDPPAPEDPALAVSVAYAFGARDSHSTRDTQPTPPVQQIAEDSAEEVGVTTIQMPAVQLDELVQESAASTGEDSANESVDITFTGDSVDIPVEEIEAGANAVEAQASAAAKARASSSSGDRAQSSPEPEVAPAGKPRARRRVRRASTQALTEEDLEEVLDLEEPKEDKSPDGASGDIPTPGVPAVVAALEKTSIEAPAPPGADMPPKVTLARTPEELQEQEGASQARTPKDGAPAVKPPPAPQPVAKRKKPWFETLFEEDYLRTLPFLTPQATQAEACFVMDTLELAPGAQVLDVGCGYGRHSMELAARGYHVVALDSSLPLLLRGADEAQRRGLDINFVHGDMREIAFEAQFDGAFCLFSTFGYFDDETNKQTAQNIARALKPGGRFIIEVLNRDYIIEDLPSRVWWEGDGCVVLEEVEFNYFSSRLLSHRSVVFDDGRQLEHEISMRAYSLHEFGKLLHAAGFRVLEISGSMATRGRFFGNKSRDLIVIAERRSTNGTSS